MWETQRFSPAFFYSRGFAVSLHDNGADAYFALHSIMDAAHKNKQPELEALLAIL